MPSDLKEFLRQAAMQVGAGGSAGFVEVCIMHPLDLVKTRLQLQASPAAGASKSATYYNGVFDCIRKMAKAEGVFSLYKGILPPVLVETPKRAVKFLTFEQYKRFFLFGSDKPTPLDPVQEFLRKVGIGFVSGTLGSIVNIPFDVAKSRIQGPQPVPGQVKYRTTFGSMAIVAREEGFAALYKGLTPKVMRLGPGGAIMLVVYDYVYEFLDGYFK
uniref:Mitochondrial 2-oxodicarboxylate carrier n=1 Tax=Anopheles atroparvus TaxID=41427 RepID=A0A182IN01_ANOAO